QAQVRTLKHVAYYYHSSNVWGILKITLPVLYTDDMLNITIKGMNYNTSSVWEMQLGGHLSIADSSWVNCSAMIRSSRNMNFAGPWSTVRFGNDGVNSCILIGQTSTQWSYPYIVVDTVQVRRNGGTELSADWTMTLITSEEGITVQQTI